MESPTLSNIRPLGDRVVIEHVAASDKSEGGVHIPDTAKEPPLEGWIVALGPLISRPRVRMSAALAESGIADADGAPYISVGDRVLYSKYSGSEIRVSGVDILIISEKDILAVIGHRDNRSESGSSAN